MKKYLTLIMMVLFLIIPLVGASTALSVCESEKTPIKNLTDNFTHTVFVEYATLTTCAPCVKASDQLYSIYNSGDLDFYYVSLVGDVGNDNIVGRLQHLKVFAYPDVLFDGGYKRIRGAQTNENPYRNAITESGERIVPDIDIDVDVTWVGGGTLTIIVTVTNNEASSFQGMIRMYVVEKESRWLDNSGKPYHYAAIDIPIDQLLSVPRSNAKPLGDTYTYEITWEGSLLGFGDITQENIIVFASVFEKKSDYVVETAAAEPTTKSNQQINQKLINTYLVNILEKFFKRLPNTFPILKFLLGI